MSQQLSPHRNIHKALELDGEAESLQRHYARWAHSYDADVIENYYGIRLICELLHQHMPDNPESAQIIDVGCGTGLLGPVLQSLGYPAIDGLDLSEAMVAKARQSNSYRQLFAGVNLQQPTPDKLSAQYDAAICLGVFTPGHAPPEALTQLATLTRSAGTVVLSTRTSYYDTTAFQAVSDRLEAQGTWRLRHRYLDAPYRDDGDAHYWVYEVL